MSRIAHIDIHKFDEEIRKLTVATRFEKGFKIMYFSKMKDWITTHAVAEIKNDALHAIDVIQHDMETPANFLGSYADDLIAEIVVLLEHEPDQEVISTFVNLLAEHYYDMAKTNGWCPSGRATRTWDIYRLVNEHYIFKHQLDDTILQENAN